MRRWLPRQLLLSGVVLLGVASSTDAFAQFGPGGGGGMRPMGPGGQGGAGGMGPEGKEDEGPAEAAPENQGQEPAIQPLPAWPGQREKALQFFQLNGYMRGRGYLFHDFNLGIKQGASGPQPAFPLPYEEFGGNGPASCSTRSAANGGTPQTCQTQDLFSADMRLRLEPTINVSEQVRVKAQIDIFDNMVMGSTPEGYYINGLSSSRDVPLSAFTRSQAPPVYGVNSLSQAIAVKRAWAEVRTPIGELRFGRMPSHWGMGMLVNNGDCLDCDYGTNADRVMFVTKLWNHFIALMWDWVATGPTTQLYTPNQLTGQFYNADAIDDVMQWGLAIGRQDKPEELKEKVERGELVLNYGGYFVYRQQGWDQSTNPGQGRSGGVASSGIDASQLQANLTRRDAWAFIPDLWFRLNWHKFHLEAEAALIGGKINHINDLVPSASKGYDILQFGGVLRADYKLLRDALHIGIEVGSASGDPYEDPNARLNFRTAQYIYPDGARIGKFNFDPDYHVDLILFRRILGTVSNATYFKPSVSYDLTEALSGKLDVIYSVANNAVAYPGNDNNLGLEIDGSIMYRNDEEGFYAGVMYGILFPFDALKIKGSIYGSAFDQGPQIAQSVELRLVVKF